MCFDFGCLSRKDTHQSLLNQSTGTSEPVGAQGGHIEDPSFHFSEGPNVRRGGLLFKEGRTSIGLVRNLDEVTIIWVNSR